MLGFKHVTIPQAVITFPTSIFPLNNDMTVLRVTIPQAVITFPTLQVPSTKALSEGHNTASGNHISYRWSQNPLPTWLKIALLANRTHFHRLYANFL